MTNDNEGPPECETCGVKDWVGEGSLIPVWETPSDYAAGESPDYIGCTECNTMEEYDA
jgi:hypothetical protein